jgi:hypothetical protein
MAEKSEKSEKPSFWSTLPGILTGISGIILAIVALLTVLHSMGIISNPVNQTTVTPTTPVVPPSTPITSPTTLLPVTTYSATIWSWNSNGWLSLPIFIDGSATGYTTPHTFNDLTGSHSFRVPDADNSGNKFTNWSTGETTGTILVSSAGTYTARYYIISTTYSATIWSWNSHGWLSMPIMMDGSPTGFSTPHSFNDLSGSHTFTVPDTDSFGIKFTNWSTGETTRTISIRSEGTYTARYFVM